MTLKHDAYNKVIIPLDKYYSRFRSIPLAQAVLESL
jgi:hypothetical protein